MAFEFDQNRINKTRSPENASQKNEVAVGTLNQENIER
jgi:hypothetical protein